MRSCRVPGVKTGGDGAAAAGALSPPCFPLPGTGRCLRRQAISLRLAILALPVGILAGAGELTVSLHGGDRPGEQALLD